MYVITSLKVTYENPASVTEIYKALYWKWAKSADVNGELVIIQKNGYYVQVGELDLVAPDISWVPSK